MSAAAAAARQKVSLQPTGAALGADIERVDLAAPLSPEILDAIKQAWADHLVLRFRGQPPDAPHPDKGDRPF